MHHLTRLMITIFLLATIAACSTNEYHLIHHRHLLCHDIKTRLERSGIEVLEYGDNISVILPTDAFFATNSARLDEDRKLNLEDIVMWIRSSPRAEVEISAYTDNVGHENFKQDLSDRQAHSIAAFLWAHGIHHTRLKVNGYGSENAVASNRSTLGSSFNRHIEIHWLK